MSQQVSTGGTYLKATNDEQRVDAVGMHLGSDLLQVLPGECPETGQTAQVRRPHTVAGALPAPRRPPCPHLRGPAVWH